MFVLPLFKVPIKAAMGASIAVAAVLGIAVQGFSLTEVAQAAWSGYHPQDPKLAAEARNGVEEAQQRVQGQCQQRGQQARAQHLPHVAVQIGLRHRGHPRSWRRYWTAAA